MTAQELFDKHADYPTSDELGKIQLMTQRVFVSIVTQLQSEIERLTASRYTLAEEVHRCHVGIERLTTSNREFGEDLGSMRAACSMQHIENQRLTAEVERLKAEMARWKNELDLYYRGDAIQTYGKPFTEDLVHGRIDAVVHLSQLFFPETGLLQQPHPVRLGEYQATHPEKFEASHPDIDEGETCDWTRNERGHYIPHCSPEQPRINDMYRPSVCHCGKRIVVKGEVKS